MSTFEIKSGDRLPAINAVLARADGVAVDLTTAASVHFVMRGFGAAATKVNAVATVVGSATLGQVTYFWVAGDTDTPGIYDGSWVVTWLDGTRQTFPTEDYLEIVVSLDLTQTGALIPVRPTDGVRPPVSAVGGLLANRGLARNADNTGAQFTATTKPNYGQVQSIIDSIAGDIDGELNGVALTPALARMARWCITLGAAATVELVFFPEQANSGGDTSGIWWSRYQLSLERFRTLLAEEGGGPALAGSLTLMSPTVAAGVAYAAQLQTAGLLPDVWITPPETWW